CARNNGKIGVLFTDMTTQPLLDYW
nr:immunoglobulin heavy chain junction region [Macaca mulatta]MOX96199.1 immunoglobulin heavy chain junction region [Macaca mulatta]